MFYPIFSVQKQHIFVVDREYKDLSHATVMD